VSKPWSYEDDHDWDDAVDYAAKGYVYWYGKYYPKEYVGSLYPAEVDGRKVALLLGGLVGVGVLAWSAVKAAPQI
jgi:hypothetical protein